MNGYGQRRKTRSDKFPLTLHPTGQYCKKIKGRIHYFGTDKKHALERYLDQATYLHGCQDVKAARGNGSMALNELCDRYLRYQHAKVLAGELTPKHYTDQIDSLGRLVSFLGKGPRIKNISTPHCVARTQAIGCHRWGTLSANLKGGVEI